MGLDSILPAKHLHGFRSLSAILFCPAKLSSWKSIHAYTFVAHHHLSLLTESHKSCKEEENPHTFGISKCSGAQSGHNQITCKHLSPLRHLIVGIESGQCFFLVTQYLSWLVKCVKNICLMKLQCNVPVFSVLWEGDIWLVFSWVH